jgi:hypothetical protein
MSKPKNNVTDLLAAIKRQPTNATPEKAVEEAPPTKQAEGKTSARLDAPKKLAADKKPKRKIGRAVQFWMHDEDIKLVRELSAWLAGQGIRPSDSLVIRAVLRLAKTGSGLLEAYAQAAKLDGRLKHD